MSEEFQFPFGGFIPIRPMSQEEVEAAKSQQERHEMEVSAFQHDWQRLIEDLSEDQLRTLRTMMHICGSQQNPSAFTFEAAITWQLKAAHGICATCGVNHDNELHDEVKNEVDKLTNEVDKLSSNPVPYELNYDVPFPEMSPGGAHYVVSEQDRIVMDEYHLDDVYDADSRDFLYFKCTGIKGSPGECGYQYATIADRVLKGPEECPGCYERIKHG